MAVDHERHTPRDYEDTVDRTARDVGSGAYFNSWGILLGVIALLAILWMLFVGFGTTPTGNTPQTQTGIERTAPTPTPAPTPSPAPSTAPN